MNRTAIADHIVARLQRDRDELRARCLATCSGIGHVVIDDLLPESLARQIHARFPAPQGMRLRRSMRELKYVSAQMDSCDPLLEESVFAFQDPRVVTLLGAISGIDTLSADEALYAGGISLMGDGHFLNPHLDNSHDAERRRWRVMNLLYYVTPDWPENCGGNLELWPEGVGGNPLTLHSRFNRLIIMLTHDRSWHSVSPIEGAAGPRCCVSNYYFSEQPLHREEQFHVTTFRGRPGQRLRDALLRFDGRARMALRRIFRKGMLPTSHIYRR